MSWCCPAETSPPCCLIFHHGNQATLNAKAGVLRRHHTHQHNQKKSPTRSSVEQQAGEWWNGGCEWEEQPAGLTCSPVCPISWELQSPAGLGSLVLLSEPGLLGRWAHGHHRVSTDSSLVLRCFTLELA